MRKYNRIRLSPEQRKRLILFAAVDVALDKGLYNFSIANVSRTIPNCSKATIKHYFTMNELRTAVIEEAVETSCQVIIGAAVAMKHPMFSEYDHPICEEEKQKCLRLYLDQGR